ncbi:MAG TPA: hypothetical protein VKG89_03955 [Solirubrobacterales bacterium]|nr:hypothetical protein [Solirubrobacterales bacterium]
MRAHLSRRLFTRIGLLAAVAIGAAFGVASLASASDSAKGTPVVDQIKIKGNTHPHFVFPSSVHVGDQLEIVNKTNPTVIGPHTFSLVKHRLIPNTKREVNRCGHKGHICKAIGRWHKNGARQLSQAGSPGWDKQGDLKHRGDSWFTTTTPGTSFQQVVSAPPGTVLHFMCGIHAFMHGQVLVKP